MAGKIILPSQQVTVDTPDGVDPIWYEKLGDIAKLVEQLNTGNLAGLIAAGGYSTGVFTPGLTFAVPGDLAVAYTTRQGFYTKIGRFVSIHIQILTSSFVWTTSSGLFQITGLPFASLGGAFRTAGPLFFQGITKAGYSQFNTQILNGVTTATVVASNSGAVAAGVNAPDVPSGGTVFLVAGLSYFTT